MASPLRSSTGSRSTTPQRSNTANGPLTTLYEAPILSLQPSPRPSPARQMLDHDQRQLGPDDDDEEATLDATPPRRLLDLFLQSASKSNGPSSSLRASPAPPIVRPPLNDKDELPTWTFYEDSPSLDASFPSTIDASLSSNVGEEDTEMLSPAPDSPPPTNENAPPPPSTLPRRSRSANSLAPPAPNGSALSAPSASPRSRATTAPLPPPISLPPNATATTARSPPSTPPPLFPSLPFAESSFPILSPSLHSTSQSFFGDTGTSSFEMDGQSRASSLLPGFVAAFSSPRRGGGGVKRGSSEEMEEEEGMERKRLRMSVEGE